MTEKPQTHPLEKNFLKILKDFRVSPDHDQALVDEFIDGTHEYVRFDHLSEGEWEMLEQDFLDLLKAHRTHTEVSSEQLADGLFDRALYYTVSIGEL